MCNKPKQNHGELNEKPALPVNMPELGIIPMIKYSFIASILYYYNFHFYSPKIEDLKIRLLP